MKTYARIISLLLFAVIVLTARSASSKMSIVYSKHNLSITGPGPIKSSIESRICIFCHTPHNANALTPLWNKKIEPTNYAGYDMYTSSTMISATSKIGPTGPSRLCLSCHDGTIALGNVLRPPTAIAMMNVSGTGGIPAGASNFGQSLLSHHPVSISYLQATANPEIAPDLPPDLLFYGNGIMQCTTCHDAHDDSNKKFLRVESEYSMLCTKCHSIPGWDLSSHNTVENTWNGHLPDPWGRTGATSDFKWTTVRQNGCENCHAPHNAGGPQRLLNYQKEEDNCYPCHNGNVASMDIKSQFGKLSTHQVSATTIGITANHHEPNESALSIRGHVECVDCHNPHVTTVQSSGSLSGKLAKVSGVDISGSPIPSSSYEYEICFKCHANESVQAGTSAGFPIPRVVNTVNLLSAFQRTNRSTHFVAGTGMTIPDVPSIPSINAPSLTPTTILTCTDCHDNDTSWSIGGSGPRGPHGSQYSPLVRQQYSTIDFLDENATIYGLCYWCHNRDNILGDFSFQKNPASRKGGHKAHLTSSGTGAIAPTPCATCHDPHGVPDSGDPGSHTHLINFNMNIVSAKPGNSAPFFTDKGLHSGSCTLVCHGITHDGSSKFSYGGGILFKW